MKKFRIIFVMMAMLSTQQVFAQADIDMSIDSAPGVKSCIAVAQSCISAGYSRTGDQGKTFWVDCMKPLLLGKSVPGLTIDSATVKSCRSNKIDELKKELNELQQAG